MKFVKLDVQRIRQDLKTIIALEREAAK